MKAIRIKNFRSILNSGNIEINNLNLLLGKNSSGKSSFLRLFPMFKQTVRNELRGPVLWFDESYDFGNYSNAYSRYAEKDGNIMFGFTIDFPREKCSSEKCLDCFIYKYMSNPFMKGAIQGSLDIYLNADSKGTFLQKIEATVGLYNIVLSVNDRNDNILIKINDNLYNDIQIKWKYNTRGILPDFAGDEDNPSKVISQIINKYLKKDKIELKYTEKEFRSLFSINSLSKKDIYTQFKRKKNNSFAKLITESMTFDDPEFSKICDSIIFINLMEFLLFMDKSISTYFTKSHYITPLRYSFTRYIRNKDLAVDNIDPSGKNVMEYILSLGEDDLKSYISFLETSLGISVTVEGKDENKSIYIQKDEEKDNIIDVGYGYSQILPIATMLWDVANKQHKCEFSETIVIEQPEIHLHPSMQADLVNLFINALNLSKEKDNPIKLILETHSSYLVNKLGRYIREEKLSSNDVSVYLFDKNQGITNITSTKFDNHGRIQRWPIGFLD